jgi:hypothetical protein
MTQVDSGIHPTLKILHAIKLAHSTKETRDGKLRINKNLWQ